MPADLARFVERHAPLFVVTGAGCSTDSGIADYRDRSGQWKRPAPIQLGEFMASAQMRCRYWARSMAGWPSFSRARPNFVHAALVALERGGYVRSVVTQNVDGLHAAAGQRALVELHGNLARVVCLGCGESVHRDAMQARLLRDNPAFVGARARMAPDGDADIDVRSLADFVEPRCLACEGVLKPDVVFYGESVPKPRVAQCFETLADSRGVLALGSSLMVFSSFRFCRRAREAGLEIAVVNRGVTRADELAALKLDGPLAPLLREMCRELAVQVGDALAIR